jgi:hypothetical protein
MRTCVPVGLLGPTLVSGSLQEYEALETSLCPPLPHHPSPFQGKLRPLAILHTNKIETNLHRRWRVSGSGCHGDHLQGPAASASQSSRQIRTFSLELYSWGQPAASSSLLGSPWGQDGAGPLTQPPGRPLCSGGGNPSLLAGHLHHSCFPHLVGTRGLFPTAQHSHRGPVQGQGTAAEPRATHRPVLLGGA